MKSRLVEEGTTAGGASGAELGKGDHRQLLNYLYASMCEVGLLLNFGAAKIETNRKILTNDRKSWLNPAAGTPADLHGISGKPPARDGEKPRDKYEGSQDTA